MPVDTTSVLYDKMADKWGMIHALLGGTRAMRDAGTLYLPQEPKEEHDKYNLRLNRSFLFGAYPSSVKRIVAKPFSRPVDLTPDFSGKLERFDEDVDGEGTSLTQFSKQLFEDGVNYGLAHFLVDFPIMPRNSRLSDEIGVRPTWIRITPPQLISWNVEVNLSGTHILTEIRFIDTKIVQRDKYKNEEVSTIRVIRPDTWEIWEQVNGTFELIEEGEHSFGSIPLQTVYLNKTGFLTGAPPLEDLAWLNVRHWQSSSDQTNILRFARCGIMHAKGFSPEEVEGINIGPNELISSNSEQAELKWVEHSGKAIQAGERDIEGTEERMELLGLQPFIARSSASTATSKLIDESKIETEVQAWIRAMEQVLEQGIAANERWLDLPISNTEADIFNEFNITIKATADIEQLIKVRLAGELTSETFLTELKRRGLISDSVSVKDEVQAAKKELDAERRLAKVETDRVSVDQ